MLSSSSSSSSDSSSSSMCCSALYCDSSYCSYFSSWIVNGMNPLNSDNCVLYASFDVVGGKQQVELYKDVLFSQLVAVGQRVSAGSITLNAVNSSNLSGSVTWGGTAVNSPAFATLSCEPFSSSSSSQSSSESSSSSNNSESSSSTSYSDSSSSSSHCCIYYLCNGSDCSNFSSWIIYGANDSNTVNCELYVQFDYITPQQQIRIYNDVSFEIANLVALGQGATGVITLFERNDSGITGSVTWDGTPKYYPDYVTIGCDFPSSSSSSSSSLRYSSSTSSRSTSSFSSLSSSSSSSSSLTSRSSVSTSSSLSTSSTSIDSSSSSSESIGNFSSSSSSSLGGWNKTKPLIWGLSAVNSSTILNRLAQTILLTDDSYSIGKAFCYLYGLYGTSSLLTIHLDLYTCDDSGKPQNLVTSSTLSGSNINGDGWYAFNLNVNGTVPSNRYLSFVMWQENGDENNYILWGYTPNNDAIQVKAWISNDGLIWTEQERVVRALRVISGFNAYDLTNFRILSPPAAKETIVHSLTGGVNDGTKLVSGSQYTPDKVEIDYSDAMISFVVDGSGSMGWNDRLSTRVEFIREMIDKFKQKYPSRVLVDMVRFGAQIANTSSITSNLSNAMTIKLDLTVPARTAYMFTVSSAVAYKNDIYKTNGYTFTVASSVNLGTTLICNAVGNAVIPSAGTLEKDSGIGDDNITYTTYAESSISDPIVAYGFKNFEDKHNYYIGEIVIGDGITQAVTLDNWQTIIPNSEIPLSIGSTTGPKDSPSLNLVSSDQLMLRRPISTPILSTSKILDNISIGDVVVHTDNILIIQDGQTVDLIDNEFASLGATVTNVSSTASTFDLTRGSAYDIANWTIGGGLIQQSNITKAVRVTNINAELLVRDVQASRDITFFLQTSNGLTIEWDFRPTEEWYDYNIYWLGETALLPVSVFDSDGYPFPDGTKVIFYVNYTPDANVQNVSEQFLVANAPRGSTKLFLSSLTGLQKEDSVNILNSKNEIQTTVITETGTDSITEYKYVKIENATIYDYNVIDQAKVVLAPTAEDISNAASEVSEANLLPSSLSLVDITPIYTGKSIDPKYLAPYDPTPLPPSTSYASLNLIGNEYVQSNIHDIPSIDGQGAIRILPITEDNLKTVLEKNEESSRILRPKNDEVYTDQTEQNTGDYANSVSTTTTTTLSLSHGDDYEIENPIYLENGVGESSMTSRATQLTVKTLEGFSIAQVASNVSSEVMVKQYDITPAIVMEDSNQNIIATQFLNDFTVYFTPPYGVYSEYSGTDIPYVVKAPPQEEDCTGMFWGYTTKTIHGVYATGNSFEMNYIISDKGLLIPSGELRIRIYSNTTIDIAAVVEEGDDLSRQDLNYVPPREQANVSGAVTVVQPLSEIDTWRTVVEDNVFSQILQDDANMPTGERNTILSRMKEDIAGINTSNAAAEILIAGGAFTWYTEPERWTKATQYGSIQDMVIPIVNGKASFTVPSSDISALLMIQASFYFGDADQYEMVRSDLIAVANPIEIETLSPSSVYAEGGDALYEIGTSIKWKGDVIDDNVVITFDPARTSCIPAVSKTDKGWAGGIMLGPHEVVTMQCDANCPRCYGTYEVISITVSYLGYQRTVKRILEWTGEISEEEADKSLEKYFYVSSVPNSFSWADGSATEYAEFRSNLPSDLENITWQNSIGENGIDRLMGFDQSSANPDGWGQARRVNVRASGLTIESTATWETGQAIVKAYGLNQNIGNRPPMDTQATGDQDQPPWEINAIMSSTYRDRDSDGASVIKRAVGAAQQPYYVLDTSGNPKLIVPYPKLTFREPLQIAISLESYQQEFIRDGVDSPNIVAEVTWEGAPILNNVAGAYFPTVKFEAGICSQSNSRATGSDSTEKIDNRGGSCLVIGSHPDVSLSNGAVAVSLSRTDIYNDGLGNEHTHECAVNYFGDGSTNRTIVLVGSVEDHTHEIQNYVSSSAGNPSHTHDLRSVAVTQLDPTTNPNVEIAVNAYVFYDPTGGAIPYTSSSSTPVPRSMTLDNGTVVNRMMFNTLTISSKIKDRELVLTLNTQGAPFTALDVTKTERAINVIVEAKFSEYSVEDYPGHWIIMPEKPVSDGTRIIFEIYAYKPNDVSKNLEVKSEKVRKYMVIQIRATVYAEELHASVEDVIIVESNIAWLPSITKLLDEPTTDDLYIASALAKINTIGASQIHDAMLLAAQRIIDYQTENPAWKSSKKVIFLLTDGDENTSEKSIDQAINNVNFIDGKCIVPVVPIRLGYAYGSDDVLLKEYASETCGTNFNLVNASTSDVTDLIQQVIHNGIININSGIYTNTIDLGRDNLSASIALENLLLPYGSRVLFRYRLSSDNVNWGAWSSWYSSSVTKDFSLDLKFKARYFQYQIYLYGNEDFESPEIYAGITLSYYKAQNFVVFFQPVDLDIDSDEYLASIHITHKATIPPTSTINYGYTQFDTVEPEDYYSITRPMVTPDRHTIILDRYNELFLTQDYQKYTAINGRWPKQSTIEVYRISTTNTTGTGELIDPGNYAANYKEGSITFYNAQDPADKFVLCLYFDPVFRILSNIVNYGPEAISIDHIGILYNIAKRIPVDSQGIIIHTPLNARI